jgi:hypothetical protein
VNKTTVLLHSAGRDQFLAPGRDLVFYDRPFDVDKLSQISEVHLWAPLDGPIDRLPEVIAAMAGLKTLRVGPGNVSPSIIARLRQGDLPGSVEELFVHTGARAVVWPDVVAEHVTTLHVDGPFRFANESFPNLRRLSIYPHKSLSTVRQALALPLEELNLLNVPVDEEVFRLLEPARLRRLGLRGGRTLTSLTGISALPQLESLRLKNLSALGDVAELRALRRLEILDIQYCKRITGIEAANELPSLRDLTLLGCGDIGLEPLAEKLATLDRVNTDATT